MSNPQTVTRDELLAATNPEALANLMARGDDVVIQGVPAAPVASETTEAVDAASGATTPPAEGAGATPGADSSEHASGVATKSGKGVLPYSVLADERAAKQRYRDQAAALQQQLEEANARLQALQASGSATPQQLADALGDVTDEEIAAAEPDLPLLAKVARALKTGAAAAPRAAAPAPAPVTDPQDEADDTAAAVHAAISTTPLLAKLQAKGGAVWHSAVQLDNQLQADPAWSSKPLAERFAEVQRRIADELGIEVPASSGNQRTPAAAPAPAAAPTPQPQPQPFRPNTLSDLGGATPTGAEEISERADGMALARRFAEMSDAQVQAAIRRATPIA